jgi:hypothetical protein
MQRGQGRSWPAPGDRIVGQSTARLLLIVDEAVAVSDHLEGGALADLRIDTDDLSVDEVVETIMAKTGWPSLRSSLPACGDS